MMISKIKLTIICTILALAGIAQTRKQSMRQLADDNLRFAAEQYKYLMKDLPPDVMPKKYDDP